MEIVGISDKKRAKRLMLSKILDDELHKVYPHTSSFVRVHNISKNIVIDSTPYKINDALFNEIFSEFISKRTISNFGLNSNSGSYFVEDIDKIRQEIVDLDSIEVSVDKIRGYHKENDSTIKVPLIDTPSGTKWGDINIRWLNGDDVEITLNNNSEFKEIKKFKELGFYDEKRRRPDMRWRILTETANHDKKISWANVGKEKASLQDQLRAVDAFQRQISQLRKQLKNIFGINGDPLTTYSNDKEYVIKINLIPEKGTRKKEKESWRDSMSEAELEKYDKMSKEDFINNPNQLPTKERDY